MVINRESIRASWQTRHRHAVFAIYVNLGGRNIDVKSMTLPLKIRSAVKP